jgi:formylglycine-generating enzyme required for sulfatase activity
VSGLLNAAPGGVPAALQNVEPYRGPALALLRSQFRDSSVDPPQRLHAAYALAQFGEAPVEFLIDQVPGTSVSEAPNLIGALAAAGEPAAVQLRERLEGEKDPQRRARYAIAMLRLGDPRGAERVLALAPDPTCRTAFIHGLAAWHGDLPLVPGLLRSAEDPGLCSGLCAAVGLMNPADLAVPERDALADALADRYRQAPDGGTHSAAGWALRRWGRQLPDLDPEPESPPERDWFVNRRHMTMLRARPGTLPAVNPMVADAKPCAVRLTRPFFICDRETWVDLFQQWLEDPDCPPEQKPRAGKQEFLGGASPTGDCPVAGISWFDAVLFCNWLSRREGRHECYTLTRQKVSRDGKEVEVDVCGGCDFEADGYRLPTEAEWDYACRAGTTTAYFFGDNPDLLPEYGFLYGNSRGRSWPGGTKLPNAWGLFDAYGNAAEWCWDWYTETYPSNPIDPRGPAEGTDRVVRGGFYYTAEAGGSWFWLHGFRAPPETGMQGFRVVCGAVPR